MDRCAPGAFLRERGWGRAVAPGEAGRRREVAAAGSGAAGLLPRAPSPGAPDGQFGPARPGPGRGGNYGFPRGRGRGRARGCWTGRAGGGAGRAGVLLAAARSDRCRSRSRP